MTTHISGKLSIKDYFCSNITHYWFYLLMNDEREAEVWGSSKKLVEFDDLDNMDLICTVYAGTPITPEVIFEGLRKVYVR